jgi:hypothetical protein
MGQLRRLWTTRSSEVNLELLRTSTSRVQANVAKLPSILAQ